MEYGYLIMKLHYPFWDNLTNKIEKDHLHNNGIESSPHVTILGNIIHNDINLDELTNSCKKYLSNIDDISVNGINIFDNENFNVLKFSLSSDKLSLAHEHFSSNYNNEDKFDKYKPHATIAYLQKHTPYDDYLNIVIDGTHMPKPEYIFYSDPNRNIKVLVDFNYSENDRIEMIYE